MAKRKKWDTEWFKPNFTRATCTVYVMFIENYCVHFHCEAHLSVTDRRKTFKQEYQQLSMHNFTVSAHISTVCCPALPWAVHSVLTSWVLPCLWSPSLTESKSWGLHRRRSALLLYTRTKPCFLTFNKPYMQLYFQTYAAYELNIHEWIFLLQTPIHLWISSWGGEIEY